MTAPQAKKEGRFLSFTDYPRIFCGLRWDPFEAGETADIDLTCALFDEFGEFIKTVSSKHGDRFSEFGSIYHSGDDAEGVDQGDDERITLDLFAMPQNIHHIFLIAEICGSLIFDQIRNPLVRLVETKKNSEFFNIPLGGQTGGHTKSFIFVRLDRQSGGWTLNFSGLYPEGDILPVWKDYLKLYIPAKESAGKKHVEKPVVPTRGETVPLFYTRQAQHRIICGLSWDAGGGKSQPDIDLTCLLFNDRKEYSGYVTSLPEHAIDSSGAVYHTGDNVSGAGQGDDEQISVELIKLPPDIHHVVFIADMKSEHTLSQVRNPAMRIADGMTNRNQIAAPLADGGAKNSCLFAHIFRRGDQWMIHYIHEYIDSATISDWIEPVEPYLQG